MRIAAVADVHFGRDARGSLRPHMGRIAEQADVLVIAGDLTRRGKPGEAAALADELRGLPVPTFAVLGNHDYESRAEEAIVDALAEGDVRVLRGEGAVVEIDGRRLGIAGTCGFGGGFVGASGSDFGEPEMKSFIARSRREAAGLEHALAALDTDVRIALLHYAPVPDTLVGERLEIYPFLGSYLLAEAIDRVGADLVIHGHAHGGSEKGVTPGGVPVRNVAQPLIGSAFIVYCFDGSPTEQPAPLMGDRTAPLRGDDRSAPLRGDAREGT